jgi:glucose-6-phosphate 1-dehydrogenase
MSIFEIPPTAAGTPADLTGKSRAAGPCALAIFGITGDLTRRLLFPSLYHLAREGWLPREFAVVGFAIDDLSEEDLRGRLRAALRDDAGPSADSAAIEWLLERVRYIRSDFGHPAAFEQLKEILRSADQTNGTQGNYLFYLATAPDFFLEIAQQLARAGLLKQTDGQWRRMVIEKPFGVDLPTARDLNRQLNSLADESQIYRIDHYLGKETVQNILVYRFASGILEPIWNRRYIDHVQITVAETLGVESRGPYYDHTGALRDMVPNHLLQLLTFIAMEPPNSFSAEALHSEQAKVMGALPPLHIFECDTNVVKGQYQAGTLDGKPVPAYRQEPRVAPDSGTETYVAMKLAVDNWRWAGVPFYLRTGKRLGARSTTVMIEFRKAPLSLFRSASTTMPEPNRLIIYIQPQEAIVQEFAAKVPGPEVTAAQVAMRFNYQDYFGLTPRTGYETLLYDAMIGDASLFKGGDVIEAGWGIVEPVLEAWGKGSCPLHFYPAGSEGPSEADQLLRRDGRAWRPLI